MPIKTVEYLTVKSIKFQQNARWAEHRQPNPTEDIPSNPTGKRVIKHFQPKSPQRNGPEKSY